MSGVYRYIRSPDGVEITTCSDALPRDCVGYVFIAGLPMPTDLDWLIESKARVAMLVIDEKPTSTELDKLANTNFVGACTLATVVDKFLDTITAENLSEPLPIIDEPKPKIVNIVIVGNCSQELEDCFHASLVEALKRTIPRFHIYSSIEASRLTYEGVDAVIVVPGDWNKEWTQAILRPIRQKRVPVFGFSRVPRDRQVMDLLGVVSQISHLMHQIVKRLYFVEDSPTEVLNAIRCGDIDSLCLLIEDETLAIANHNYNPLVLACRSTHKNSAKIVGYLLRAGADPNHVSATRELPLHVALRNRDKKCRTAIVKQLLKYDADPSIRVEGKNVFDVIADVGCTDVISLFQ